MTFQIELDEGTAARRLVPFRLFTSDGTSPDTGASDDTMFLSINGAAQVVSAGSVSAISAAAGMYSNTPSAAQVGTIGSIAFYHNDGDFPQHVVTAQVVNYNPMSTQSDLLLTDLSIGTVAHLDNQSVGTVDNSIPSGATIAGVTNVSTEIAALNDIDGSEVTVHAGGIASTAFAAGAIDAAALADDAGDEIADRHLNRDMATGADSGSSAVRTPRDALRALRNRVDLSENTLTVFEEDDTTEAWRASLTTSADLNFPTAMDPSG